MSTVIPTEAREAIAAWVSTYHPLCYIETFGADVTVLQVTRGAGRRVVTYSIGLTRDPSRDDYERTVEARRIELFGDDGIVTETWIEPCPPPSGSNQQEADAAIA